MTTVEHRRDKDMVPILVEIELKVNQYNYLTGVYERRYLRTFVPSYLRSLLKFKGLWWMLGSKILILSARLMYDMRISII